MTSLDWLFEKLWELPKDKLSWNSVLEQAKEMHNEEIIESYSEGRETSEQYYKKKYENAEQYYQEIFVSKGSSEVELP